MEKTKLIELLKSLSQDDQKKLLRYHIKIEPKHQEANYLMKLLFAKFNSNSKAIDREKVEVALKRKYPKSKKRLNDLTNELTEFVNDFLLMKILNRDSLMGSMTLLRYYHEHNLEKNYNGYATKVQNMLRSERDNEFHHHNYLLIQLEVMRTKDNRKKAISPADIDEALEFYYLENKLRLACEQAGRSNIVNAAFEGSKVKYLLEKEYDTIVKSQLVRTYMWIYLMIIGRSDNSSNKFYQKIQAELAKESRKGIEKHTLKAIYEYLMNECTFQINSGSLRYAIDYILCVKRIERTGVLLNGEKISPVLYKNFINMSLIAQYVAKNRNLTYTYSVLSFWLDEFERKYRSEINGENAEAIGSYCKVLRHIHDGAYKEANNLYSACLNTHDFYHDIACRKMQLQISYATYLPQNKQFIISRISAFNKFISRNEKLTEQRKKALLALCQYLRKMLNDDYDMTSNQDLLEDMKHNLPSSDYIWFEKIIEGRTS